MDFFHCISMPLYLFRNFSEILQARGEYPSASAFAVQIIYVCVRGARALSFNDAFHYSSYRRWLLSQYDEYILGAESRHYF